MLYAASFTAAGQEVERQHHNGQERKESRGQRLARPEHSSGDSTHEVAVRDQFLELHPERVEHR